MCSTRSTQSCVASRITALLGARIRRSPRGAASGARRQRATIRGIDPRCAARRSGSGAAARTGRAESHRHAETMARGVSGIGCYRLRPNGWNDEDRCARHAHDQHFTIEAAGERCSDGPDVARCAEWAAQGVWGVEYSKSSTGQFLGFGANQSTSGARLSQIFHHKRDQSLSTAHAFAGFRNDSC